jgi:hypothetical protein
LKFCEASADRKRSRKIALKKGGKKRKSCPQKNPTSASRPDSISPSQALLRAKLMDAAEPATRGEIELRSAAA